jgi:hypothetical protein
VAATASERGFNQNITRAAIIIIIIIIMLLQVSCPSPCHTVDRLRQQTDREDDGFMAPPSPFAPPGRGRRRRGRELSVTVNGFPLLSYRALRTLPRPSLAFPGC